MLRRDGEQAAYAPQPGLDQVEELCRTALPAGVPVEWWVDVPGDGVRQALSLAAFRIVQEGLANAARHARGAVSPSPPGARAGACALLNAEPDVDVVGAAADGLEAASLALRLQPDVVLMDVRMPNLDGIGATRRIMAAPGDHHPRVFVLTTFDIDDYVYEGLRAGASGFLLKDARGDELVNAVRVVAAGEALLAPSVTRRLSAEFARRPTPGRTRPPELRSLTPRESEVLTLIARRLSNAEIAEALVLAEQTVKTHVGRLFAKLGLRDRAHAVMLAYETGLVRVGE